MSILQYFENKILNCITLSVLIIFLWCYIYNRMDSVSWSTPVSYESDTIGVMAVAKAYSEGDFSYFSTKYAKRLNAPFEANWNDYPKEEMYYAFQGILVKLFGLYPGMNIGLLLAHILAGATFWFVGNWFGYNRSLLFAFSILYAFTPYIFWRGMVHILLSYYFVIPVFWMVLCIAVKDEFTLNGRLWILILLVLFFACNFSFYYTIVFMQLFSIILVMHIIKKNHNKTKYFILSVIATSVIAFVLTNFGYFWTKITLGSNFSAAVRNIDGLEVYGLKLIELFATPQNTIGYFNEFWMKQYHEQPMIIRGEIGSGYIGIVGILGLTTMICYNLYFLCLKKIENTSMSFWISIWILFYSLIGGLNHFLGVFGFTFMRGTNRFSIIILTLSFYFLVEQLSKQQFRRYALLFSVVIVLAGIFDQFPAEKVSHERILETKAEIQADIDLVETLEQELPEGSMIFQLPVMEYPEVPPIHKIDSYQPFRPYINSNYLRFSYGSIKGRTRELWQHKIKNLNSDETVFELERFGFSVLLINKDGYADNAAELKSMITNTGKEVMYEDTDGRYIAFKLNPETIPDKPKDTGIFITFLSGWSIDEGLQRWSISNKAKIELYNTKKNGIGEVHFQIVSLIPRKIEVYFNNQLITEFIQESNLVNHIDIEKLSFISGKNIIRFETDKPPQNPGTDDLRELSFCVIRFESNIINN